MKNIFLLFVIFISCSTSNTSIASSCRDPGTTVIQGGFKKNLAVIVKDEASRRIAENKIAASNPNI